MQAGCSGAASALTPKCRQQAQARATTSQECPAQMLASWGSAIVVELKCSSHYLKALEVGRVSLLSLPMTSPGHMLTEGRGQRSQRLGLLSPLCLYLVMWPWASHCPLWALERSGVANSGAFRDWRSGAKSLSEGSAQLSQPLPPHAGATCFSFWGSWKSIFK